MHIIDIAVLVGYILFINIIGFKTSKSQNLSDYFVGNKNIPWIIACLSIVATETSTLTFISIPGVATKTGFSFLYIALGYIVGRFLVSLFLLPGYFKGNIQTVYQFLQSKFSSRSQRVISVLFHITRLLADGIRLFATAIPLALLTGLDFRIAILIIGVATLFYTLFGGISSVAFVDSIQLGLYVICAIAGLIIIPHILDIHFSTMIQKSISGLQLSNFLQNLSSKDLFKSYNLLSGIIGGGILSLATHGTDHLMAQRVLACKDLRSAKKAMITSGFIVFFQFALFLLLGLCIQQVLGNKSFSKTDEIFPYFIIHNIPVGLKGLMFAGIFAAAMSSLSSSINSLSASTVMDILHLDKKNLSETKQIRISRFISFIWTITLIVFAIAVSDTNNPVVEIGLAIASVTFGPILGIFFAAIFLDSLHEIIALAGVFVGITVVICCKLYGIFWPWFAPIGFLSSFLIMLSGFYIKKLLFRKL